MTGKKRVGGEEKPPGRQDGAKREWIASQLRRVYDEALQEDIPADMLAILNRLDEAKEDGDET
jgi:Anti-sigma factor NepR